MKGVLDTATWLRENEDAVRELMPKTWTSMKDINMLAMGFGLKKLGLNWNTPDELGMVMVYFEKIGFMMRSGHTVKGNPNSIFEEKEK